MSDNRINICLLPFIFFLLIIHYSCVQSISEPESELIEILNTSIELDRFENELFFQVETNQKESQKLIQNVSVELTYIGDDIYEYSETFQLYDNATNGDLIPYNGIYTLLTYADTVILPNIEPGIENIDMAENFMLYETNPDSLDISVTIYGKSFQLITLVLDTLNKPTDDNIIINLDNS